MRRRLVSATPVACLVSLGLATMLLVACGEPGAGSSATPLPPIAVPTEVTVEGRAVPAKTAELASSMAGMVLSVPVEEGEAVTAGAVLVQLDPAAAQVELDAASAAVDAAAAGLAQAKAAVDQAEAGVDQAEASLRAARAAEDQLPDGASSAAKREAAAQVDAAEAALTGARAQAESAAAAAEAAAAEQRRAESARAGAQLVVDRHAITAPFAGRVSSVGVQPGELVGAGQVLARLADTSGWTFETDDADEAVIGQIEPGARATVSLDGLPGVTIPGTVSRVGTYGTELQGDVRYTVVVTPDGDVPDGVRWNMTATMEIAAGD